MGSKSNSSKNSLLKFRERKSSLVTMMGTNKSNSTNPSTNGKENEQTPPPKRYLRETGFNQMINEMIISTCQKYMEINLRKRLIYYGVLVVIGSILCDGTPGLIRAFLPFKTEKSNVLNQYFVKIGWFWTLVLLVPFQCLTRKAIDNSNKWYDLKSLVRVLVVTLAWYLSVSSFNYIEISTGKCSKLSIKSRRECLKSGWSWMGFDISGHTFILLFANLILFEESRIINGFENFGYLLDGRDQELRKTTNQGCSHYKIYNTLLIPVRVLYILITFLALLWDFMLIQTVLNYHSFLQKVLAFLWSVCSWHLCYHVIFSFDLFDLMPLKTPTRLEAPS